jgi:hypothetical protein
MISFSATGDSFTRGITWGRRSFSLKHGIMIESIISAKNLNCQSASITPTRSVCRCFRKAQYREKGKREEHIIEGRKLEGDLREPSRIKIRKECMASEESLSASALKRRCKRAVRLI